MTGRPREIRQHTNNMSLCAEDYLSRECTATRAVHICSSGLHSRGLGQKLARAGESTVQQVPCIPRIRCAAGPRPGMLDFVRINCCLRRYVPKGHTRRPHGEPEPRTNWGHGGVPLRTEQRRQGWTRVQGRWRPVVASGASEKGARMRR